ncbi:MAG: hypothetical protein KAR47_15450, partial [Planctomycetes bacterium]|nr:hypothetical protein [Planctomycetota bacterium]
MFKKLCLLAVLMAMVAVTANVAQAGSVRESFGTQGTIDMHYADNETTLLQADSGLTWGGYNTYTGTRISNALVLVKPAGLQFDKWVMDEGTGSYAYTSWDGVLPSLDMSNGAEIELTARESTGVAVEFSILLRAGGTWYVSETNVTIQDTIVIGEPQLHTFDPAATTWEELDPNTNSMLNAQADGDERPIVGTGTTGITLTTELADVTGGGLLVPSCQERNPVQFDFIKFSQDPTLNDEPVVTINNSERWAHLIDSYNPGTDTAPGTNWVYLEDGKGWQAINNAEAFDDDDSPSPLTYTWEAISYVGTETDEATAKAAVEFNRSGGDDGAGANALDPNIVYNYRGTYTVTLTAFDGADYSTPATLTTHVVDNIAPTVTDIAGNLERTRYVGDILKLNPAISDDNYPVDFAKTEQHIRYLSGPVGSMTFRYGSGASYRTSVDSFVGIGKGHPMVDSRSPEDPNITFPVGVLGVYKFDVHAYDGDMYSWESDSDPNQTWTINVIDNRAMTGVDAGGNQIGIKDRNVNLIGTINDPDYDEHPENQTVIEWSVEEGPGGAGYTIGDAGSLVTTFNADTPGEYTLQLHVREESLSTGIIDANDTTVITIFGASYKTMTIKPSDDTSVRGGNLGIGQNYGGEVLLRTRDGDAGDYRKAYVKFDLNQIPGVITTANATFSIMSAESMNDFDTEIHNTSYGEGGEWFEGDGRQETDTGLYPDTTGVGLTYDSDTLPVTRGRVARRAAADWGSDQRKTFDVSGMRIEDDNKVTFRISTLQDDGNEDFYSKEASDLEAEQSPLLTIAYDPNQPHMPSPPDGMSQVDPMLAQLGWRLFGADKGTQECEVFFGTDSSPSVSIGTVSKLDAPNHMTDPNMVFDLASHVTLPLTPNLTYYWYVKP